MKTEKAKIYTEIEVAEVVAKAIKQDRELQAQMLRALPVLDTNIRQGWIENPKALQKVLAEVLCPREERVKQEVSSLRPLATTLVIPPQQQCVVANCFTDKTVFVYRDSDFDNLLPETLPASGEVKVVGHELTKVATEQHLSQVGRKFTNLLQIEDLILRTEKGEETGLITDGYANIFPLEVGPSVFTVYARRGSDGWGVYCSRFDPGFGWNDVYRFFSLAT